MIEILQKVLNLILSNTYINLFNMQKLLYFLITEEKNANQKIIKFKIISNFSVGKILLNRIKYLISTQNEQFEKTKDAQISNLKIHQEQSQVLQISFEYASSSKNQFSCKNLEEYIKFWYVTHPFIRFVSCILDSFCMKKMKEKIESGCVYSNSLLRKINQEHEVLSVDDLCLISRISNNNQLYFESPQVYSYGESTKFNRMEKKKLFKVLQPDNMMNLDKKLYFNDPKKTQYNSDSIQTSTSGYLDEENYLFGVELLKPGEIKIKHYGEGSHKLNQFITTPKNKYSAQICNKKTEIMRNRRLSRLQIVDGTPQIIEQMFDSKSAKY